MPLRRLFLIALLLGLAPAAQAAESWAKSFEPAAIATFLESVDAAVLVASTGEESKGAEQAIVAGLRASGKTRLVMDGAVLGAMPDASDADIVKKAAKQPVELIAVVRVFPGATNQPPVAVVTFYSKQSGNVLSALSVVEGTPLVPRRNSSAALPSAAMDSVAQVVQEPTRVVLTPEEMVRGKAVYSASGIVQKSDESFSPTRTPLYRGDHGFRLDGPELYSYLGRPADAKAYQSRTAVRVALGVTGLIAMTTGGIVAGLSPVVPGFCTDIETSSNVCIAHQFNYPMLGAGLGVAAAGLGLGLAALILSSHPLNDAQLLNAIDEFNTQVKADAQKAASLDPRDSTPPVTWSVAPVIGVGVGGLAVRGTF